MTTPITAAPKTLAARATPIRIEYMTRSTNPRMVAGKNMSKSTVDATTDPTSQKLLSTP